MKSSNFDKNSEKILPQGIAAMGLHVVDEAALSQLNRYLLELLKWNRKMNLVAKAPVAEIIEKHFLDSLTLLPFLQPSTKKQTLMDVGSGAGFPGLPIKIACPDLHVTLVEPRRKRLSFLNHVIRTLQLQKILVLETRIQPEDKRRTETAGLFDFITCRALTETNDFLKMVRHLSRPGGKVICMKGPKGKEEVACGSDKGKRDGFELSEMKEIILPFSKALRYLIVFTKTEQSI